MDLERTFDGACVVLAVLFGAALLFDPNLSILGRIFGATVLTAALAVPAILALRDTAKPYGATTHGAAHETDIESVPD